MPWKLIDKQDRSVLGEGRSQGIGYAMAQRKGTTLTTVDPISPCKDYLNDRAVVQARGGTYSACGLTCTHIKDLYDTHAYLIMSVCKAGCRALKKYEAYDKDVAALESNHLGMQKVINWLEGQLSLKEHTRIERIEDNRYVIIAPLFWTEATYLISLYTLIIRAALYYKDGDIKAFLLDTSNPDAYMLKMAWPRVERMIKGEIPKQDFSNPSAGYHGMGICYYPFDGPPKPFGFKAAPAPIVTVKA